MSALLPLRRWLFFFDRENRLSSIQVRSWLEMATQKPVEWVSSLIIRFEEQVSELLLFCKWRRLRAGLCTSAPNQRRGSPFIHSPDMRNSVAVRRRMLLYWLRLAGPAFVNEICLHMILITKATSDYVVFNDTIMFLFQLPYRTGPQTSHACQMVEQNKECLIQISKYKFSLVISGLTKILQRVNESVSSPDIQLFDSSTKFYFYFVLFCFIPTENSWSWLWEELLRVFTHSVRHIRKMSQWPTKRHNKVWWSHECQTLAARNLPVYWWVPYTLKIT